MFCASRFISIDGVLLSSGSNVWNESSQDPDRWLDVASKHFKLVALRPACRFDFFIDKVLPQYRDSVMAHTLIYVPSYFDYVRLRNHMKKEELNFVSICEYSSKSEVSRARHFFQKGDKQFLLFTERFHFYKRSVLSNAPPEEPHVSIVRFEGILAFTPSGLDVFLGGYCSFPHLLCVISSAPTPFVAHGKCATNGVGQYDEELISYFFKL